MSNIPSVPVDGMVRTDIVTEIATITAPKAATEISAASSKHISCYITAGGFNLTPSQASISDDRECDTFTAQAPGRVTVDNPSITVIDNTGTALSATANDAVTALTPGATVYIVRRHGVLFSTAPAAAQIVDVWKCIVGKKQRIAPEANSVFRSTFPLFIQDYAQDVALVA
jgi:hypothetical protein